MPPAAPARGMFTCATGSRSVTLIFNVRGRTRSTETEPMVETSSRFRFTAVKSSAIKFSPNFTFDHRRNWSGAITPSVFTSTCWMANSEFS